MNHLQLLLPRPIRDIIMGPKALSITVNPLEHNSNDIVTLKLIEPSLEKQVVSAITRVALTSLALLTLSSFTHEQPSTIILGSFISAPTVALFEGTRLMMMGGSSSITAIASNSFTSLATSLAYLAAGWIMIEKHDIVVFGLAEAFIDKATVIAGPFIHPYYRHVFLRLKRQTAVGC